MKTALKVRFEAWSAKKRKLKNVRIVQGSVWRLSVNGICEFSIHAWKHCVITRTFSTSFVGDWFDGSLGNAFFPSFLTYLHSFITTPHILSTSPKVGSFFRNDSSESYQKIAITHSFRNYFGLISAILWPLIRAWVALWFSYVTWYF